jgi:hypothetical protein
MVSANSDSVSIKTGRSSVEEKTRETVKQYYKVLE